ncbi:MAG: septum formation protein Maf [Chitinophagales bacterium]|nr:septum formation protein Maf [Chitinophagales bacterium]
MLNISKKIFLASKSPRRRELLSELQIPFKTIEIKVEETVPDEILSSETALFLAEKKAKECEVDGEDDIIITADTIVIYGGEILGKPIDFKEAEFMLKKLSGKVHEVITGVCLKSKRGLESFQVKTYVEFDILTQEQINFYINEFKPFDKAGAYGIQEWIGMIGIRKIEGDYFNVVGLPLFELHKRLSKYISHT